MSTTSSTSPISPLDRRDIRSNSRPFKRDKDHRSKWSDGVRPGAGVTIDWNASTFSEELRAGSESQKEKVRPHKSPSQTYSDYKTHANKTPKPSAGSTWGFNRPSHRIAAQTDAHFECHTYSPDDSTTLSKSLLELIPSHTNNNTSSPSILPKESEILYSFDNKGPSPSDKGRKVELGGLVEKAEKKWVAEQTEKIVRGEYEVLDLQGEKEIMRKGKRSPKQKAAHRANAEAVSAGLEDDDGFELV